MVFVSLGSTAENIEAGIDYLREPRSATVGSIHLIVIRPFPEAAVVTAPAKGISWVSADMIRDAQLHRRRDAQGSGRYSASCTARRPRNGLDPTITWIADERQSSCIGQLCVAKQIPDDVCGKHSAFGIIAGQEFDRAEPVIFVLPVRFNVVSSVHTFSLVESPSSRIHRPNSRYEQLSQ